MKPDISYLSPFTDPFTNLYLEDRLLRNLQIEDEVFFLLYINEPSVVLGRNQSVWREVNLTYSEQKGVRIARRISGGGAVFHDTGNLNIACFVKYDPAKVNRYDFFMQPLIDALQSLGINTRLNERNALLFEEKKLSGNAQFTNRKNLLSHCTLLFDTDPTELESSIQTQHLHIESIASPSVRSTIVNLRQIKPELSSLPDFASWLGGELSKRGWKTALSDLNITQKEIEEGSNKMRSFEWVFARSPKSVLHYTFQGEKGSVTIEKGLISEIEGSAGKWLYLLKGLSLLPGVLKDMGEKIKGNERPLYDDWIKKLF